MFFFFFEYIGIYCTVCGRYIYIHIYTSHLNLIKYQKHNTVLTKKYLTSAMFLVSKHICEMLLCYAH